MREPKIHQKISSKSRVTPCGAGCQRSKRAKVWLITWKVQMSCYTMRILYTIPIIGSCLFSTISPVRFHYRIANSIGIRNIGTLILFIPLGLEIPNDAVHESCGNQSTKRSIRKVNSQAL
uniref:Uncharacterized protein n=1 Tax=Cacopsylla melanoneura TaxID=428564 RepID=A0A8D8ZCF9_9HEMI